MPSFDFVTDSGLRRGLQDDHREMERCFESAAWKSVHVLGGSIVEAILADYLISSDILPAKSVLKLTLGQLVDESEKAGVLSRRTVDLSSAIREYRNLIHPGRKVRLSEEVDVNGATVVRALVDIVAKEVAQEKRRTYGYTAEQLLSKLERDRSVISLLRHLVSETKENEIRRLLCELIPKRLIELVESPEADPLDITHLGACHRNVVEPASDEIRGELARQFVEVAKSGSSFTIQAYLDHLFRAVDLVHLEERDRRIALDRLLAELKETAATGSFPDCLKGLSAHIAADDVSTFVDPVCKAVLGGNRAGFSYLSGEYRHSSLEMDERIVRRLKQWEPAAGRRENPIAIKYLNDLIVTFDRSDDLPF